MYDRYTKPGANLGKKPVFLACLMKNITVDLPNSTKNGLKTESTQ